MSRFAVIGLGRYGARLARELAAGGSEVIAIDSKRELVEDVQGDVDLAIRMDAREERALLANGVDKVDAAVVAIGDSFESSILATAALKKIGVKHIIARASTDEQERILRLIQADEVVRPVDENARRLARQLVSPSIIDYIELADGHSVIQLAAPKKFLNHQIGELDIRQKYDVNIVAIKKQVTEIDADGNERVTARINDIPKPTDVIEAGDVLFVTGSDENLARLPID